MRGHSRGRTEMAKYFPAPCMPPTIEKLMNSGKAQFHEGCQGMGHSWEAVPERQGALFGAA